MNDEGWCGGGAGDGEAYERLGSAFDRYKGVGVGSGVGATGLGGVCGWYETRRIWEELKGRGESFFLELYNKIWH